MSKTLTLCDAEESGTDNFLKMNYEKHNEKQPCLGDDCGNLIQGYGTGETPFPCMTYMSQMLPPGDCH